MSIQQLNALFQKGHPISEYNFDTGKEIGGISYSTLKHETTVTTDSVQNEERLVQKVNLDDSLEDKRDISIFERSNKIKKISDDIQFNKTAGDLQQSFETTNHIDYYDLFQRNNIISEDQTFIQNQSRQKIFLQNEGTGIIGGGSGGTGAGDNSKFLFSDNVSMKVNIKVPKTYLDANLFYPDAFESQPFIDITQANVNKKYINIMNGNNLNNFTQDNLLNVNPDNLGGRSRKKKKLNQFKFDDTLTHNNLILGEEDEDGLLHLNADQSHTMNLVDNESSWNDEAMFKMLNFGDEQHKILLNRDHNDLDEDQKSEDEPHELEDFIANSHTLNFENSLMQNLMLDDDQTALNIRNLQQLQSQNYKPQQANLRHLVNYIHGDLYHCAICSSKFEEPDNLPRVLFCGDCLCEKCIRESILPQDQTEIAQAKSTKYLRCLICQQQHNFKMTKSGFVVCNDNFVKIKDDSGMVNYNGNGEQNKFQEEDVQRMNYQEEGSIDEQAFDIPEDLIIRSIPINVELIDLIREKRNKDNQLSLVQQISKFIQLDQLSKSEARYYLKELCKICEEDMQFIQNDDENDIDIDSLLNSPINHDNSIGFGNNFRKETMFRTIKDKFTNLMSQDAKSKYQNPLNQSKTILKQKAKQDQLERLNNSNNSGSMGSLSNSFKNISPFKKASEDTQNKYKQILQNSKSQILQTRTQSKNIFKQHFPSQTVSNNHTHTHHHHHQHTGCTHQSQSHHMCKNCGLKILQGNSQQALSLLSKKHQKMIKNHFGPGNHAHFVASRKDITKNFEDLDIQEDEEGLDEREPEKAIQQQRLESSEKLKEFDELNPLQDQEQNDQKNSSSKKNKRKKKKRQKAKQQKQEQKLLLKNGVQMDESQDTDLYSMLIPPEEFQQNLKSNVGQISKQALRNPFQEYMPNENFYQLKSLQDKFQGLKDNNLNFPLLCENCCKDFVIAPDALSMNYLSSQQIQLPKLQSQMKKELLEAGLLTVISHQCLVCVSQNNSTGSSQNQLSLCLICSLQHKQRHPNHTLKQVLQKTFLQTLSKKNPVFENLLNMSVTEKIRDSIDEEISKLVASMRQIFKLNKVNPTTNQPNN
ncbi:UNKNOWN [Stylonychia lemnae]|uniref:RING-type domain-containing protein n=1 Tax=Stylonychia lemnae TaxID=5949 RepID=A0A078AW47_STYLE|nr:UNKNOWN [Stylonychia lemnae]|eukprot:CDW85013.1 UNKNOWN [Stylonychia lemnae]